MPSYHAPLREMHFLVNELCNLERFCQDLSSYQDIDATLISSILEEAAKFAENILHPINQTGDQEGCRFENGKVYTPKGFKEAYQQFVQGGWMALGTETKYGGQGLPKMLQVLLDEMLCSANVSFSLYTVLTQGAVHALTLYGSEELQRLYLSKLVSGEWSGTMCLTESHCGTDLGLTRTKAEPCADGSYTISGTKIFITSGEHDLTENIIHTVLARLPNAPAGTKGISMFLVPKNLANTDGSVGKENAVYCGSIEHKMGIRGSATCVINFENAKGFLIGEPHQGMRAMFSMMNLERLNIGLEGVGLAEIAYQNARNYAKERLQSRAPTGPKYPNKYADPIIVHPDVRRMLLFIKAFTESARALVTWMSMQVDLAKYHTDSSVREQSENLIAFLTPVIKAFFTDYGSEACNTALQIFGGHGYIKEWGMEQFVRDLRIAQIYEGTNGIQALDLVKRKLVLNKGQYINEFREIISKFIAEHQHNDALAEFIQPLEKATGTLSDISYWIIQAANKNEEEVGAASTDYLHMVGLVALAFMWAKMAAVALPKLKGTETKFYANKIHTARFYYQRILPRIETLKHTIQSGSSVLMAMEDGDF